MATKNVTLRMPEEMTEYLLLNYNSINQAVITEISYLRRIRQVSLGEIKGLFSETEWVFMADVFKGTIIDDVFCANVSAFIAACEDAEKFDHAASVLHIDFNRFLEKIRSVKGANIEAIYSRIKYYWNHSDSLEISKWAKF